MVRKEFTTSTAALQSIHNAVRAIVSNYEADHIFLPYQLQEENEEKYLASLYELFTSYIKSTPIIKRGAYTYRFSFKKKPGFILTTVFIAVIIALIIINSVE